MFSVQVKISKHFCENILRSSYEQQVGVYIFFALSNQNASEGYKHLHSVKISFLTPYSNFYFGENSPPLPSPLSPLKGLEKKATACQY